MIANCTERAKKMEYGCVWVYTMKSKRLHETVVVHESERKPGCVYKFYLEKESTCCRCKELGKYRRITVKNDRVVRRKHLEDDHHNSHLLHTTCQRSRLGAGSWSRHATWRQRDHGKRPRDAYSEMLTNVAKRFRSSEQQVLNVALCQMYATVRIMPGP